MGAIKEFQDFWHSLSKTMRTIILILLLMSCLIVITFFSIVCFKSLNGEPVKIFGIEINQKNQPIPKIDTPNNTPSLSDSNNEKPPVSIDKRSNTAKLPTPTKPRGFLDKEVMKVKDQPTGVSGNGVVSTGANAHVVAGSNNNVAINGDVFVNTGFELTDVIKGEILSVITNSKKRFNVTSNCLTINNTQYYNGGGKFLNELEQFLVSKGFEIKSHALIPGNFNGLLFTSSENCLDLNIGYF